MLPHGDHNRLPKQLIDDTMSTMLRMAGIQAFVQVAEHKSFRGAARVLGLSPTAVSKSVSRLEASLGARLLHRTSRRVSLTPEGEVYLTHCREALARLKAGEDELTRSTQVAKGTVRVSLSFVFGRLVVNHLHRLLSRFPRLEVALSFADRAVDLAAEGVDVAVRIGELPDSALVARRIGTPRWATVASPSYLARAGEPRAIAELEEHACLRFARPSGRPAELRFLGDEDGPQLVFRPSRGLVIDHGDFLVTAAVAGLGVAQVFDFMVEDHIRRGELVEILADRAAPGPPVHAITLPRRQRVPKVRAFVDFMAEVMETAATAI